MTVDEYLDKLTERQLALLDHLKRSSLEWDRRPAQSLKELEKSAMVAGQKSRAIDTLGRVAELHKYRLNGREDV